VNGRNWAEQYHNSGFIIREVVVETDFEVPTRPAPGTSTLSSSLRKPDRGHGTRPSSMYFAATYRLGTRKRFVDMSAITRCSRLLNLFVKKVANSL
jgi:hypothetical protein